MPRTVLFTFHSVPEIKRMGHLTGRSDVSFFFSTCYLALFLSFSEPVWINTLFSTVFHAQPVDCVDNLCSYLYVIHIFEIIIFIFVFFMPSRHLMPENSAQISTCPVNPPQILIISLFANHPFLFYNIRRYTFIHTVMNTQNPYVYSIYGCFSQFPHGLLLPLLHI